MNMTSPDAWIKNSKREAIPAQGGEGWKWQQQ